MLHHLASNQSLYVRRPGRGPGSLAAAVGMALFALVLFGTLAAAETRSVSALRIPPGMHLPDDTWLGFLSTESNPVTELAMPAAIPAEPVEIDQALARRVAEARARWEWGPAARVASVLPVYDLGGEVQSYDVDVTLDGSDLGAYLQAASEWRQFCRDREGSSAAPATETETIRLATITVSANYDRPPVLASALGLSAFYGTGWIAAQVAGQILGVSHPTLDRILQVGVRERLFEFTDGARRVLVQGYPPYAWTDRIPDPIQARTARQEALAEAKAALAGDGKSYDTQADSIRTRNRGQLEKWISASFSPAAAVYIGSYASCFVPFESGHGRPNCCLSQVMNYYDERYNYGKLISYFDTITYPEWQWCHVPNSDYAFEDYIPGRVPDEYYMAMVAYANGLGYNFSGGWNTSYNGSDWGFGIGQAEVDGSHPFVWTRHPWFYQQENYFEYTVVGYDTAPEPNEWIVHQPWNSGGLAARETCELGLLDWVFFASPHEGGSGLKNADLTQPDGGHAWQACAPGEEIPGGELYTIRWDSRGNPAHHVKIEYSTDGGSNWQTIISNQPDVGFYSWTVPCITSNTARIRITQYDASSQIQSADGSYGDFKIINPVSAPPTLLSPADGVACQPLSGWLTWSTQSGATAYEVQIGTYCGGGSINQTTAERFWYSGLVTNTVHFWRVRAIDACGQPDAWSACRSFATGPVELAAPSLLTPADGAACQPAAGTLDWSDVPGAAGYHVEIGEYCGAIWSTYDVTASTTSYSPLPQGRTFTWRVQTKNACGNGGPFSACRSFTVINNPLVAPTLLSPSNGSTTVRTSGTLDWSDVAGAVDYRVRIGTSCGSGATYLVGSATSQYAFSGLIDHQTYYWQVQTKDACSQWGAYSGCFSFTTRDPATYIIKPDGTGSYPTIQAAINAALNGDIVELTDGTFRGTGNRDLSFGGKAITVRSQSGNPQTCVISPEGTSTVMHRGFSFSLAEGPSSILDGVRITLGYASNGGAFYFTGTTHPTIRNCYVDTNYATGNGGAVYATSGAYPTFESCEFYGNYSFGSGGAFYCAGANPVVQSCVIRINQAAFDGGGMFLTTSSPTITATKFLGNSAGDDGGGLCIQMSSAPHPTGCVIAGNTANDKGGGIYCYSSASPLLSQCTLSLNSATSGGGIACEANYTVAMDHTIISASELGGSVYCDGTGSVTLSCSDVYGNTGGDWIGCISGQSGANGNFSANPLYCFAANYDFTLHRDSPCAASNNPTCGQVGAYDIGCGPSSAITVTVRPDGTGDYPTIQDAIDDMYLGSTILLADGVFTGPGNRDLDFHLNAISIRSASGNAAACIIDCQGSAADPHRGFYFHSGEWPTTVVEGVTIRNGYAVGNGAGIQCIGASDPTIRSCIVEDNVASGNGGGMYIDNASTPTLDDCVFKDNAAGGYGGALDMWNYSAPVVTDCRFEANYASSGGAIDIYNGSNPSFTRCAIFDNGAGFGGAVYCETNCVPAFERCTFYGNAAPAVSKLDLPPPATGVRSLPDRDGTGDRLLGSAGSIYSTDGSTVLVSHSIIAFGAVGEAVLCAGTGLATLTCTDVYENGGGDWVGCIAEQAGLNGNFSADPMFCDGENGNFQYMSESPCAEENNPGCGAVGAYDIGCGYPILVKADGTGQYPTIQAAVDAAAPWDVVILCDGTYTGAGNRDIDYHGKPVTVRSESRDPSSCIIDCQGTDALRRRGFAFHSGESDRAILEAVTIVNGYVDLGPGIYVAGSGTSPTIRDCRIHDCTAPYYGGGFWIYDGASPVLEGCTIYMNTALVGGGIAVAGATATIQGCTIADNQATSVGPGIMKGEAGNVSISNSIVALNRGGPGVVCSGTGSIDVACTDVFGNTGGDWVDCIASMAGLDGNIGLDPLFCDAAGHDFALHADSPCADDYNAACGRIGAYAVSCVATDVPSTEMIPDRLFIDPGAPNPFVGGTLLTFGIPRKAGEEPMRLAIYDLSGRRTRMLLDGQLAPGTYHARWDGRDDGGRPVGSGIYFVRIDALGEQAVAKLVLAK